MPPYIRIEIHPGIPRLPGSVEACAEAIKNMLGLSDLIAFSPQGTTSIGGGWVVHFIMPSEDGARADEVEARLRSWWRDVRGFVR